MDISKAIYLKDFCNDLPYFITVHLIKQFQCNINNGNLLIAISSLLTIDCKEYFIMKLLVAVVFLFTAVAIDTETTTTGKPTDPNCKLMRVFTELRANYFLIINHTGC